MQNKDIWRVIVEDYSTFVFLYTLRRRPPPRGAGEMPSPPSSLALPHANPRRKSGLCKRGGSGEEGGRLKRLRPGWLSPATKRNFLLIVQHVRLLPYLIFGTNTY
nr:hypothetical protein [Morchella crassipes]